MVVSPGEAILLGPYTVSKRCRRREDLRYSRRNMQDTSDVFTFRAILDDVADGCESEDET